MTTKLTVEQLQDVLNTYDTGVLSKGAHKADGGAYCALECVSLARNNGRANFTDNPIILGMPDLRAINDAAWSNDTLRTTTMLPLIAALSDWSTWTPARQQRWAKIVSLETVKQITSALPGLPEEVKEQCKQASNLKEAADAADAARAAAWAADAAADAAWAADAAADAADAARAAADAAADAAAADKTLVLAVDIWLSAVAQSLEE